MQKEINYRKYLQKVFVCHTWWPLFVVGLYLLRLLNFKWNLYERLDKNPDIKYFHVLGGLNDLVSEDVVVRDPVPRWVSNLPTAGRNKLILVPNPRKETEWELQSIMSRTSNRSRFK